MNSDKNRLDKIFEKFNVLKDLDKEYKIFGSSSHKYEFYQPLAVTEINSFENKFNVKMPSEYKLFLMEAGNGGAGPYYGIVPFEKCLFSDIDRPNDKYILNPSIKFPYTNDWNIEFNGDYEDEKALANFEENYFDDKHISGTIRICNFGCGVYISLVVNGEEYSYIWVDDRGSDNGIYPFNYYTFNSKKKLTFFDWYEGWLDESINKIKFGKTKNGI
jgi:hypothetical protein